MTKDPGKVDGKASSVITGKSNRRRSSGIMKNVMTIALHQPQKRKG